MGTDNTLDAAIEAGVKCVICLSTDKAAYPINAMGITKAIEERHITHFTPASMAASSVLSVPITFVFTASIGKNSQLGTCFSAAAWNT